MPRGGDMDIVWLNRVLVFKKLHECGFSFSGQVVLCQCDDNLLKFVEVHNVRLTIR